MAEASPLLTVTPKDLGKHLRDVRRRKGLSLSEVARGAGLSRRELVAYERGKIPIPDSDLWVLAGSCGVDVAELLPRTSSPELAVATTDTATTMGDTIAQLRRTQDDAGLAPYLATLNKLRELAPGKRIPVKDRELAAMADALGRDPVALEQRLQAGMHVTPQEAARLREIILPPVQSRTKPRALEAALAEAPAAAEPAEPPAMPSAPPAFLDTPLDAATGHNVDVFEELARLPEPLPLGDPGAPLPDMLATPPPPPEGAVELVDASPLPVNATNGFAAGFANGGSEPMLVDMAAAVWNAADAPPIDVAQRQGSDTWDWSEPPSPPLSAHTADPDVWDPTPWQPPAPGSGSETPPAFWEGTDDWAAPAEASIATPETTAAPETGEPAPADTWSSPPDDWESPDSWNPADSPAPHDSLPADPLAPDPLAPEGAWATTGWEQAQWGAEPWSGAPAEPATDATTTGPWAADDPWTAHEWPDDLTGETDPVEAEPVEAESFTTETFTTETFTTETFTTETFTTGPFDAELIEASPFDAAPFDAAPFAAAGLAAAPVDDGPWDHHPDPEAVSTGFYVDWGTPETADAPTAWQSPADPDPGDLVTPTFDEVPLVPPSREPEPVETVETVDDDALPPIMWRADPELPAPSPAPEIETDAELSIGIAPGPGLEPEPAVEQFVAAGDDWQLGNALPLVEVRGQGALVMRRADERWALADVTTGSDFVLEVDVDFRSGPGLGVLFRASVDEAGRMSGYSFDVDPIYDGGGYLVRQWQSDRELWNPIARAGTGDPASMYGPLTVRLVVVDDRLVALVNGAEVLDVENLKQASTDRGREAAAGDRVGIQAWSSSDLVIDTLRVAER
jgi:transcriptional regulator with XRE-family HTH domain